jgi:hypothetical protein
MLGWLKPYHKRTWVEASHADTIREQTPQNPDSHITQTLCTLFAQTGNLLLD